MNRQTVGVLVSLVCHGLIAVLVFGLAGQLPKPQKTIVLDLSVQAPEAANKVEKPAPSLAGHAGEETLAPLFQKAAAPLEPELKKEEKSQEKPAPPVLAQKSIPVKQKKKPQPQVATEKTPPVESPLQEPSLSDKDSTEEPRPAGGSAKGDTTAEPPSSTAQADRGQPSRETEKARYLQTNFAAIAAMIRKHLSYPRMARKMGLEGKVMVSFVILTDGTVKELKVEEGSGHQVLDESACNAVQHSTPFPPPPYEARVVVPVSYRLSD